LIGHSARPASPPSTNPAYSSTTPRIVPLTPKDFQFHASGAGCRTDSATGEPHYYEFAQITNAKGMPFHFINATILLVKFTLSRGQVVRVSQSIGQIVDANQTYDTYHQISATFAPPSNLPNDVSITRSEFSVTVFVREVLPDPMIFQLSMPTSTCWHYPRRSLHSPSTRTHSTISHTRPYCIVKNVETSRKRISSDPCLEGS
jgi:hypothetical protein